jgi:hypothetical protein
MSFVRKSFAPRAGAGTEITPDKVLDNYYGFNRLLELKQGAMGDSQWDAGDSDVRSGKKYGKMGGATGTGTLTITDIASAQNSSIVRGSGSWYNLVNQNVPSGIRVISANISAGLIDGTVASIQAQIVYDGVVKASQTASRGVGISWIGAVEAGKNITCRYQQTSGSDRTMCDFANVDGI